MKILRVLFVGTYGGVRSLIAEKFVQQLAPGRIEAYSSGFESGKISPLAIAVMKEIGIDLPADTPKSVWARYVDKEAFDWVITLCDEGAGLQCSIFNENVDGLYAEKAKRLSWSVPFFDSLSGTAAEQVAGARKIRDLIKRQVLLFLGRIGVEADIT